MNTGFQLFPDRASTFATDVDHVYFYLCAVAAFFTLLIFVLILYFGLRYRRKGGRKPEKVETSYTLEATWTLIPFALTMVMFTPA